MQDQSSNTENQQVNQIMPQNGQSQIAFQPFSDTMQQGMSPFNHLNTIPGGVVFQPMPSQNMIVPFVHYHSTWQQTVAEASFGSYAQPSKKIFVMRAVPINVIQNPVKVVVYY